MCPAEWNLGVTARMGCEGPETLEQNNILYGTGGFDGKVACESALRSAGTLMSRVRAPTSAPRPGGGPQGLRSTCCGLAIYKNPKNPLRYKI
ncbi:hypothetical protein PoB_005804700 [Plakobranchus ocellatus]|uniref:Uncharacterized protein n=1 Tax=Plakobranchus ocellatus TaxID=259542 RepID=A0AAV4CIP6_9GAST|nr:hypothetical protein PoB_005804700 [Plakobranchus ocellatus]